MEKTLKSASAAFGVMPGIGVILSEIGTPAGDAKLFGGVTLAVGTLSIMALWIFEKQIRKVAPKRLLRWVVATAVLTFVSVCFYVGLFGQCVVKYNVQNDQGATLKGELFFPLFPGKELDELIETAHGRHDAIVMFTPGEVAAAISKAPMARSATWVFMLFLYQAVANFLVVSLGLAAIRAAAAQAGQPEPAAQPPAAGAA